MFVKELFESLRRSWASWVALGIPFIVVVAVVAALIQMSRRQATIEWIQEKGGSVTYSSGWLSRQLPPKSRSWLDKKLGGSNWSKPFDAVTAVDLEVPGIDEDDLKRLRVFKGMDTLVLDHLSETGAKHLGGFSNQLKSLSLWRSTIDDEGIEAISRFSRLESLLIISSRVTDAGMEHIGKLKRLQTLRLIHARKVMRASRTSAVFPTSLGWILGTPASMGPACCTSKVCRNWSTLSLIAAALPTRDWSTCEGTPHWKN